MKTHGFSKMEPRSIRRRVVEIISLQLWYRLIALGAAGFACGPMLSNGAQGVLTTESTSSTKTAGANHSTMTDGSLRPISGVVRAERTGKPIARALVRVSSPAIDMRSVRGPRAGVYDARTDANGRFKVLVQPSEKLSFNVFARGYEEAAGQWMSGNWTYHELAFPSSQESGFTIQLKPAIYIAGVVLDEAGKPVANTRVEATLQDKEGYGYVAFDATDATGRFEIFDFPLQPPEDSSGGLAQGQLTFEHPAVLKTTIANIYPLRQKQLSKLRINLRRGHDLKGIVLCANGQPAVATMVEAIPADGTAARKSDLTDAEGKFLIRGLPQGQITVTAHHLALKQKARRAVQVADADVVVDLRLEPVVYKNPPKPFSLFGMKLADVSPEVQATYDLAAPRGVVILEPGPNHLRLGIGPLREGESFWIVGNHEIRNLRELVAEMLRISAVEPPGQINEGCRGAVRVVYEYPRGAGTNTQYLLLTDEDVAELKQLAQEMAASSRPE